MDYINYIRLNGDDVKICVYSHNEHKKREYANSIALYTA